MKKLFWIPLFVILMVIPMIAGAAPVAGEPVVGNAGSPTAIDTPKYALKGTGAGDEKAALASYVKGAYNAVIKGINNTQDEINTLNSGIETYADAIGHLTDGKATKDGTVATIKSARTNESINTSSVNFTGVTTTSISATASGNVNLVVPIMDDWENDSLAENPVQTTASFSGLAVNNLTISAPTSNTATLTKTGITGDVDVSGYLASAYTRLEYLESTGTQYINTGVEFYVNNSTEVVLDGEFIDKSANLNQGLIYTTLGTKLKLLFCRFSGKNYFFVFFKKWLILNLGFCTTLGDKKNPLYSGFF